MPVATMPQNTAVNWNTICAGSWVMCGMELKHGQRSKYSSFRVAPDCGYVRGLDHAPVIGEADPWECPHGWNAGTEKNWLAAPSTIAGCSTALPGVLLRTEGAQLVVGRPQGPVLVFYT